MECATGTSAAPARQGLRRCRTRGDRRRHRRNGARRCLARSQPRAAQNWFVWLKENAGAEQWAEQIALLEKQSRSIQRRQQLGDAARLEAVQAEAALAQAEAQLAQARARRNSAAEDLRRRFPGLPLSEPGSIAEPSAITGSESEWLDLILEHSHELGIARGEAQKAQLAAGRAGRDRLPDPTVGVQVARERGGEEHILGAYIAITAARRRSPGGGQRRPRRSRRRHQPRGGATQKIGAEAAALYHSATGALPPGSRAAVPPSASATPPT